MPNGLCKYCRNWTDTCGLEPGHCAERSRESFIACNFASGYSPFEPVDGAPYTREYILGKWMKFCEKELGIA